MRFAILAAAALVAATASQAEARARMKFRSSSTPAAVPLKPASAAPRSEALGLLPAVALGAAVRRRMTRSRDDVTTSSTSPVGSVTPLAPLAATAGPAASPKSAKPAYVCASDRKVGAGSGFCEMN